MTEPHVAMNLIMELADSAAYLVDHQSKSAVAREDRAAQRLFIALTGRKATAEELKTMLD